MSEPVALLAPPPEPERSVEPLRPAVVDLRPIVRQPHGGALRPGGKPGNKGGGPMPTVLRAALRRGFRAGIPALVKIAKGIDPDSGRKGRIDLQTRIKALDLMGKYGVGVPMELSGPDGTPFTVTIRAAQDDG